MELRRIDNNTYDLFQGAGWDSHTRVRRLRDKVVVLGGNRLSKEMMQELFEVLHPTMPITYGQPLPEMLHNFNHGVRA